MKKLPLVWAVLVMTYTSVPVMGQAGGGGQSASSGGPGKTQTGGSSSGMTNLPALGASSGQGNGASNGGGAAGSTQGGGNSGSATGMEMPPAEMSGVAIPREVNKVVRENGVGSERLGC